MFQGIASLDEIENEILLINSTAWLQSPSEPTDWKDEVANVCIEISTH